MKKSREESSCLWKQEHNAGDEEGTWAKVGPRSSPGVFAKTSFLRRCQIWTTAPCRVLYFPGPLRATETDPGWFLKHVEMILESPYDHWGCWRSNCAAPLLCPQGPPGNTARPKLLSQLLDGPPCHYTVSTWFLSGCHRWSSADHTPTSTSKETEKRMGTSQKCFPYHSHK